MPEAVAKRRRSAVEIVLDAIMHDIRHGTVVSGDRLPNETQLAEAHAVSRGSVREAMRTLASLGLVDIRHGDGTFVSTPGSLPYFEPLLCQLLLDQPSRDQLRELRLVVERGMIALVLASATDDDVRALRAAADALAAAARDGFAPDRLADADLAFHDALGAATHNPVVARLYGFVMQLYRPAIEGAYEDRRPAARGARYHRALVDAIAARDHDRAIAEVEASVAAWGAWSRRPARTAASTAGAQRGVRRTSTSERTRHTKGENR
ncbi:MAG: FadR family transcriptional regulator [Spirochaetaceae bacterium]|nr:MAG: FadR family transcriptional regulator [Spirochaetaceae bacterium]